jgi:hypothetical protein
VTAGAAGAAAGCALADNLDAFARRGRANEVDGRVIGSRI